MFTEGPLLILAGAGSGKTTVLVNRIANIIRFGTAHGSDGAAGGAQRMQALRGGGRRRQSRRLAVAHAAAGGRRPWNVLAITFTNKAAGEYESRLATMLGEAGGGRERLHLPLGLCSHAAGGRRPAGVSKSFTIYDTDDQQRAMKDLQAAAGGRQVLPREVA